jgi:hypothetical protein
MILTFLLAHIIIFGRYIYGHCFAAGLVVVEQCSSTGIVYIFVVEQFLTFVLLLIVDNSTPLQTLNL